jgi:hypothetical protein
MDQVSQKHFSQNQCAWNENWCPTLRGHEEQHRKNFWNAAAKNKFCSVNTTAVLIDPDWLNLLRN